MRAVECLLDQANTQCFDGEERGRLACVEPRSGRRSKSQGKGGVERYGDGQLDGTGTTRSRKLMRCRSTLPKLQPLSGVSCPTQTTESGGPTNFGLMSTGEQAGTLLHHHYNSPLHPLPCAPGLIEDGMEGRSRHQCPGAFEENSSLPNSGTASDLTVPPRLLRYHVPVGKNKSKKKKNNKIVFAQLKRYRYLYDVDATNKNCPQERRPMQPMMSTSMQPQNWQK